MSDLEWKENGVPISQRYDDPYYSIEDGRLETRHVFITGNRLIDRWASNSTFTIAELGFGTGLNFLETVYQWQKMPAEERPLLDFISFEQFPISSDEMAKALSAWSELEPLTERLIETWDTNGNSEKVEFVPGATLTVIIGDANQTLPHQPFKADAWYLDGFSPAKNPELWNDGLLAQVANHTAKSGTFATYTAAGFVKRCLAQYGFEVSKVPGFGRKRDMLVGTLNRDTDVAGRH